MILTDKEIAKALDSKQLIIKPRPSTEALSSTSVDLTLSGTFARWPAKKGLIIRPGLVGYKYNELAELQERETTGHVTLEPGVFVLGWTAEKVCLPANSRLAARVEGKSSLARLGLCVHMTAPTVHSGFGEAVPVAIQLEMVNFGPNTLILDAGMPICQLIIERTGGKPGKPYKGMFSEQGPKQGKRRSPTKRKG